MNFNESKLKNALRILYGEEPGLLNSQFERYKILIDKHKAKFGDVDLHIFSSPGRTELGGNHTDHNRGRVLAASVNLDTISVCNYNNSNDVAIHRRVRHATRRLRMIFRYISCTPAQSRQCHSVLPLCFRHVAKSRSVI